MPRRSWPKPYRLTKCRLDVKQLTKDGESPNPIWQSFPVDLFDSLFAQCDNKVLASCRLLSKDLTDVAARHLFRIVPCCTFDIQDSSCNGRRNPRRDITPHVFNFVRGFRCQGYSGEDCLAEWQSGSYAQVTKFILCDTALTRSFDGDYVLLENSAEIQKRPGKEHQTAFMTGEFPVGHLAGLVDIVYAELAPQLVWKQLEAPELWPWRQGPEGLDYSSCFNPRSVFNWMITGDITGYSPENIDELPETSLERLVMPTNLVSSMVKHIPDCNYLRLVKCDLAGYFPSESTFESGWLPDDGRYWLWDKDLDDGRISNLQWQLNCLPMIQEVDIHEWEHPVWWPLLTWTVQENPHKGEKSMLRQPCETLHIFVSLKHLETAAEYWRSELYRDDMGLDGSGGLKHLYFYLGDADYQSFKKPEKPFDPSLLLEWLQRVIPTGCRVHFRGKDLERTAEQYRLQMQEAFDEAFPRGWHHVERSRTVVDTII